MMVMLYALEHPDRVSRIVQLGPVPLRWDTEYPATLTDTTTPRPDSVALAALRALQRSSNADQRRLCEAQWAVDRYGLVGDPAHVDRLGPSRCDMPNEWPQHFRQHLDAQFPTVQALTHTWDEFRSVQSPVLTIHGTRDRNAPFGGGREWAARLPNARLIVVRDGAHQSFAEYPELVWPAVREFLLGQWPAAATTVR
jgi:pimeloyl-ACP methyl ester carboxylesterase